MSLPKETRQLMINLMYLVLTALLALNVSNEILHAFKVINRSIDKSNASIENKNEELYENFLANEKQEGKYERVHPFRVKADEVKKEADEMFKYLQTWKERIISESGGTSPGEPGDEDSIRINREDNIDATTHMLVEKGGGDTLKKRLADLRTSMLAQLSPADQKLLEGQLPLRIEQPHKTDNNPSADWKVSYFHNMPTMAAITLIAKFQNDVRNSESQIINQLFNEAHSTDIKFDAIKAIAVPKNSYVLAGQKVEAEILLAAYNKSVQPQVSPSTGHIVSTKEGVADWEGVASGVGLQTVKGHVSMNLGDHMANEEFSFQYMVGSTGASMQLDKMNVFYIGVPNPITVSAAGYSLEDVSVNIPGATVTAGAEKGKFSVMVNSQGEVNAAIMAKTATGPKQVGVQKIRVKMIPDPVAEVGGKSFGVMGASIFRAQLGIVAALKNFDFDARFNVISFEFAVVPKRGEYIGPYSVNGSLFSGNPDCVKSIARVRPGDRVFMENIKAKGPDGRVRNLAPVSFLLN